MPSATRPSEDRRDHRPRPAHQRNRPRRVETVQQAPEAVQVEATDIPRPVGGGLLADEKRLQVEPRARRRDLRQAGEIVGPARGIGQPDRPRIPARGQGPATVP